MQKNSGKFSFVARDPAHAKRNTLASSECKKVVVHLGHWADRNDLNAKKEFAPEEGINLKISLTN